MTVQSQENGRVLVTRPGLQPATIVFQSSKLCRRSAPRRLNSLSSTSWGYCQRAGGFDRQPWGPSQEPHWPPWTDQTRYWYRYRYRQLLCGRLGRGWERVQQRRGGGRGQIPWLGRIISRRWVRNVQQRQPYKSGPGSLWNPQNLGTKEPVFECENLSIIAEGIWKLLSMIFTAAQRLVLGYCRSRGDGGGDILLFRLC